MSNWLYKHSQVSTTENRNFLRRKEKSIFKISKDFRVLIFGLPGTPIHELGYHFANILDLDLVEIERSYDEDLDYFDDKIPELKFDTGDLISGSENKQMARDPSSCDKEKSIDDAVIPPPDEEPLSEEEKFELYEYESGVVVTELGEPELVQWVQNSNGFFGIFEIRADEEKVINWFKDVRKCNICGTVYHLMERPPMYDGVCDRCGSYQLNPKPGNSPKEVRHQFNVWRAEFEPLEKAAKVAGQFFSMHVDDYTCFEDMVRDMIKWIKSKDDTVKGKGKITIKPGE